MHLGELNPKLVVLRGWGVGQPITKNNLIEVANCCQGALLLTQLIRNLTLRSFPQFNSSFNSNSNYILLEGGICFGVKDYFD